MITFNCIDEGKVQLLRRELSLISIRNVLTGYFLPQRILKRRWLIPIVFITILIFYQDNVALTTGQQIGVPVNAWDVVVGSLNNKLSVYHGLTNLLVYLVSDIALLEELDQLVLLKIGSRWRWAQVQAICVIATVILYIVLIIIIILGVTVTTAPWHLAWSPAAMSILNRQGLPANTLLKLSPLATSLFMLTLLGLAWIGMGVVVSTITLATQKSILGFAAGLALNYSALIIWLNDVRSPLLDKLWLHQRMFLWHNETAGSLLGSFIQSALYWVVWIAISIAVLWSVCRSVNIVQKVST